MRKPVAYIPTSGNRSRAAKATSASGGYPAPLVCVGKGGMYIRSMQDNLLEQFLANAKVHFETDYADRKSVKKANDAVSRLFKIAEKIRLTKLDTLFDELLRTRDYKADLWIAHILLERLGAQDEHRNKAIEIIERYATDDSTEGLGERMWLEQWRAKEQ